MTAALTPPQIEILLRALKNKPLWHGEVIPRLGDEVVLLEAMHLIERDADARFRLTECGRDWLQRNAC